MMKLKDAELILMKNLKGQKNKMEDILVIAQAASIIKKNYSNNEIKNMYDITMTTFDRVNAINKLNSKGKSLVKNGLLKMEQAYHLSRVDSKRQDQVAKAIASMNSENTRLFVSFVLKQPKKSIEQLKKDFDKNYNRNISIVVTPMPDAMYNKLLLMAESKKKEPHNLIIELVEDYLGK